MDVAVEGVGLGGWGGAGRLREDWGCSSEEGRDGDLGVTVRRLPPISKKRDRRVGSD